MGFRLFFPPGSLFRGRSWSGWVGPVPWREGQRAGRVTGASVFPLSSRLLRPAGPGMGGLGGQARCTHGAQAPSSAPHRTSLESESGSRAPPSGFLPPQGQIPTPASPQVSGTTRKMEEDLARHLARLSEIFAARSDYLQTLKLVQQRADSVIEQLSGVPVWTEAMAQLTQLADQTGYVEYYR